MALVLIILISSMPEKKIDVTNTPKASTNATADLTIGLVLAVARRIVEGTNYHVQLDLTDGHLYFSEVEKIWKNNRHYRFR